MKIWTYAEARAKVLSDSELQDQTAITPSGLIGYFNDGIEEAESEIHKLDEDYFLTSAAIPLVTGQSQYDLPYNVYGLKIRDVVYWNGPTFFRVARYRRLNKFEKIAQDSQFPDSQLYRRHMTNDSAAGQKMNLVPPARETAILSPLPNPFTPMMYWYIRHANRIPLLGEFIARYDTIVQASAIDTTADTLAVGSTYVTGDQVKFTTTGTLPAPLVAGTVYYAIVGGAIPAGKIKLATSAQNAALGTAIDLTTTGSGLLYISLAANQTIIDNTLIDIPEFTKFVMAVAKYKCFYQLGDPRIAKAEGEVEQQRAQMVSTLSGSEDMDDDTELEQDLSMYRDMS